MSSTRTCKNCKCQCLLVSVGCIKDQLNPFGPTTPDDRVRAAIDEATLKYIVPVIGSACFTAICSALDASELPTGDEGYAALPSHYQTFIDEYATLIISDAATALYIDAYGVDRLTIAISEEEKPDYIKRRFAGASARKQDLKTWLETEDIKALFTCLPTTETVCLEEKLGINTDFGSFAASTKYPSWNRTPERDPKEYL